MNSLTFIPGILNQTKANKIVVFIGTRPEAVKLAPVISELKRRSDEFNCIVISTGQHRAMLDQVLDVFHLTNSIDYSFNIMRPNQSLSDMSSLILRETSLVLENIKPDAVIVQGDTTTAFIAALVAFYLKIPVAHVEAGLRTRNIYSPFPEEFNRQGIGNIAAIHFAATDSAATNLKKECKSAKRIYVTGNPVVDALNVVLRKEKSDVLSGLISKIQLRSVYSKNARVILLTSHRRENHGIPLIQIMKAVYRMLNEFQDVVVIYPVHLNPNVMFSIERSLPSEIFLMLKSGVLIEDSHYKYLNRILLIEPLDYVDLIHLMDKSYFIMTDSGGIQEEGTSIGRPILVLRDNTERMEAVDAGVAILVGTSTEKIFQAAKTLLTNLKAYEKMAKVNNVYGDGKASEKIVGILHALFGRRLDPNWKLNFFDHDTSCLVSSKSVLKPDVDVNLAEIIIVLTVWKRNNLEFQLYMIENQSVLKRFKNIVIVVFQNGNHINISTTVEKWKLRLHASHVNVDFIHSIIETGYYGRFLAPLSVNAHTNSYFILLDDDIIFGKHYFANMLRVVDEGFLATRNGRFFDKNLIESYEDTVKLMKEGMQVTWEEDIEYDFGGHIWSGKIEWLKNAWKHVSPTFANAEDFWISAVLKSKYGIGTKKPKCPRPVQNDEFSFPDYCSCSDKSAGKHVDAVVGQKKAGFDIRSESMQLIMKSYNYVPLILGHEDIITSSLNSHKNQQSTDFKNTEFENCLFWV
jgi:UDP-N-acetylglucosamine 2-epimerase (non-hydrolysing)